MMENIGKFVLGLIIGAGIVGIAAIITIGVPSANSIAVIKIQGVITSSPSLLSETVSPDDIYGMIQKVEESPYYRAVVFEINSPGGSVVASREMAGYVKAMEKPTVCWLSDVAASGAYWVASSCDVIVSDPLSITGSIGATASYLEFSKLFDKYGVTYESITSGENKDMGSPFRNMTSDERENMEYIVNETFRYFLGEVVKNRNLTEAQVDQISSGGIFLGKDAIELGLVDRIGSFQEAKSMAKEIAGLDYAEFVSMKKKGLGLFDLIGMM
ncbi:MAG: signal peptide peptidase SppA [Candidatus Aenigmarchaeota archaeon]|nr:signal peptide peptidase SppA [Candidatus Aenigmarchaeota archaeon]